MPDEKLTKDDLKNIIIDMAENYERSPELIAQLLAFGAKFYRYSARNLMLIYNQNPYASYIASYKGYQELGYNVKKGEHGLKILVPTKKTVLYINDEWIPLSKATPEQKKQYQDGEIDGKVKLVFKTGTVFDISQTDCPEEDLPTLFGTGYSSEQYANVYKGIKVYAENQGIPVHETEINSISLGGYNEQSYVRNEIYINARNNDTNKVYIICHELGHAIMHKYDDTSSTAQVEFEADAFAVMLLSYFGLPANEQLNDHLAANYKKYKKADSENVKIEKSINSVQNIFKEHIDDIKKCVDEVISLSADVDTEVTNEPLAEAPTEKEKMLSQYPVGTLIELTKMRGEPQMPLGLLGEVVDIDDIGQIHMKWENGSSLALNVNEDDFRKLNVVCFDTETTGLNSETDEILQLSAIDYTGNTLYNSYFKPAHTESWDEAMAVNSITPEMVSDSPNISDELDKLNQIFENADVIIGYNTNFDLGFLEQAGIKLNPNAKIVDVMQDFTKICGEWSDEHNCFKWQKLITCADFYKYDWQNDTAHNSLSDTKATLFCHKKNQSILKKGFTKLDKLLADKSNYMQIIRCSVACDELTEIADDCGLTSDRVIDYEDIGKKYLSYGGFSLFGLGNNDNMLCVKCKHDNNYVYITGNQYTIKLSWADVGKLYREAAKKQLCYEIDATPADEYYFECSKFKITDFVKAVNDYVGKQSFETQYNLHSYIKEQITNMISDIKSEEHIIPDFTFESVYNFISLYERGAINYLEVEERCSQIIDSSNQFEHAIIPELTYKFNSKNNSYVITNQEDKRIATVHFNGGTLYNNENKPNMAELIYIKAFSSQQNSNFLNRYNSLETSDKFNCIMELLDESTKKQIYTELDAGKTTADIVNEYEYDNIIHTEFRYKEIPDSAYEAAINLGYQVKKSNNSLIAKYPTTDEKLITQLLQSISNTHKI